MTDAKQTAGAEQRAIAAALRVAGKDVPLGSHPAYGSAWRRTAAREQLDNGMGGR